MRILVLIWLVASAFAAPAQRTQRDILPGDPRYNAKHHNEHNEHNHRENEAVISKALGGYTGTFSFPDISFGSSELETGASIGNTDPLKHDIDANKAAIAFDTVKITSNKVSEDLKSVPSNSFTPPKVESVTVIKPGSFAGLDDATSTDSVDLASRSKDFDADDKESFKNTAETKVETKSASDKSSSGVSKTTIKSDTTGVKSIESFSSDLSLATDSLANPFFASSFDSGFSSFGLSEYNPSFPSLNEYNTPKFEDFDSNYKNYNNNGGQSFGLDTYSGFNQRLNSHSFESSVPVDFSQSKSLSYTENVPYLSSSAFPSFTTDTELNPSAFKLSNTQSYLSAPVSSEYQQHLFKNYNPFSSAQPTAASFAGISQQIDANGGYVY